MRLRTARVTPAGVHGSAVARPEGGARRWLHPNSWGSGRGCSALAITEPGRRAKRCAVEAKHGIAWEEFEVIHISKLLPRSAFAVPTGRTAQNVQGKVVRLDHSDGSYIP